MANKETGLGSPAQSRGQWIVWLRDVPGGEDQFLGPFHSEERAHAVAERLRRDIAAVGCGFDTLDAGVEWVRPASTDFEDFRDEMLVDLEAMGYVHTARLDWAGEP